MSGYVWNILISGEYQDMPEIYWFQENIRICLKYVNFRRISGYFRRISGYAWNILISGECQEMPEICLSFSDIDECSCKQVDIVVY